MCLIISYMCYMFYVVYCVPLDFLWFYGLLLLSQLFSFCVFSMGKRKKMSKLNMTGSSSVQTSEFSRFVICRPTEQNIFVLVLFLELKLRFFNLIYLINFLCFFSLTFLNKFFWLNKRTTPGKKKLFTVLIYFCT